MQLELSNPGIPALPALAARKIAFIGADRLATGLALAFSAAGMAVVGVASRSRASAKKLAARIPECSALDSQQAVDTAELVFITIPDDAIAAVTASLRWRAGMSVVHCSGATEIAALAPAAVAGARIGGFHPIQAFTDPEAALASLPGCTVSIETGEEQSADSAPLQVSLEALAAAIGCRTIRLPAGCRARYHASGGYASQFVNVLMREATTIWQSFGVSEEEAIRALLPLLKGTVAAIENAGIAKGMPGPVSRGDIGTIQRHVADLAAVSPETLTLYRELALRTVPIAEERGSLDAERAEALRKLLSPRD